MTLSLSLLGKFEVRDEQGTVLFLPTRKTRALLAYLAVNKGKPHSREKLFGLLWGDRGEKQARQSLNHALRAIKKLSSDDTKPLLDTNFEHVRLRPELLETDIEQFQSFMKDRPADAAALYKGVFLDDLSLSEPAYEEWLSSTRSEYQAQACKALELAADTAEPADAVSFLRDLLALDPLREDIHRKLMLALSKNGDRAGALRQYQICADTLKKELDVGPDAATSALYESIRTESAEPVAEQGSVEAQNNSNGSPAVADNKLREDKSRRIPSYAISALSLFVLVALGVAAVWFLTTNSSQKPATQNVATSPVMQSPTIAVLPFADMSDLRNQEYFSDGLTEDLLTDLSKISALNVISRTSVFAYKGKSSDVRQVAKHLGASHVVEGSVQKVGDRVRINAKLVDAATGRSLWAERYDREFKDIFFLQDEVRGKIIAALSIQLAPEETKRIELKGTKIPEAYDLFLQGRHQESPFTKEGNTSAIRFYQRAIEVDPGYAIAYARMANMYDLNARLKWSENPKEDRERAIKSAETALRLNDEEPYAHWTYGRILSRLGPRELDTQIQAIQSLERATELDPNYADAYAFISLLYIGIGESEKASDAMKTAMKLNPEYPFWYAQNRAVIYYMLGDYASAIADLEKAQQQNPTAVFVYWWLAAAYAQAERMDDANWQMEEMSVLGFRSTVGELVESASIIHHPPYKERFAKGLRKAGVPD